MFAASGFSKIIESTEWCSFFFHLLSLQGEQSELHLKLGGDDVVHQQGRSVTFLRDGLIKSGRRWFRMSCIWDNLKEHRMLWKAARRWEHLWMDEGSCEEPPPLGPRHSRICLNWTSRRVLKFKQSCCEAPVNSEIRKLIYKIRNSTSQPRFHLSF